MQDGLSVIFEDDGAGISDEDRVNLFEKGYGKHTGLGLFLSREILAITGIAITENGKQGEGARFEMTVPNGSFRISVLRNSTLFFYGGAPGPGSRRYRRNEEFCIFSLLLQFL